MQLKRLHTMPCGSQFISKYGAGEGLYGKQRRGKEEAKETKREKRARRGEKQ